MKKSSMLWGALILLYVLALVMAVWFDSLQISLVATASFFAFSTGLSTNKYLDVTEKNRPSAMIRCFVPGIGHMYLYMYRRAATFSFGYLGIILTAAAMFVSEANALSPFTTMIGIIIGMLFFSLIDTEIICNRLRLPYTGYAYEVRIKNYNLAFFVTILVAFIMGIIYPIYEILNGDSIDILIDSIILTSWFAVLIIGVVVFIVQKNCPQSE